MRTVNLAHPHMSMGLSWQGWTVTGDEKHACSVEFHSARVLVSAPGCGSTPTEQVLPRCTGKIGWSPIRAHSKR